MTAPPTRPGNPGGFKGKSIEERKRNSHCAVCGEKGHWQGDDVCQASKKPGAGSKHQHASTTYRSPMGQKGAPGGKGGVKQTFLIHHNDGSSTYADTPGIKKTMVLVQLLRAIWFNTFRSTRSPPPRTSLRVSWFWTVLANVLVVVFFGISITSRSWNVLASPPKRFPVQISFSLGRALQQLQVLVPTSRRSSAIRPSSSALRWAIPLLGSNRLLERLGAIIDIPSMQVRFQKLGVSVELLKIGGHLAVEIVNFVARAPSSMSCWTSLETSVFWKQPDPR